jgi:hypothetical protein
MSKRQSKTKGGGLPNPRPIRNKHILSASIPFDFWMRYRNSEMGIRGLIRRWYLIKSQYRRRMRLSKGNTGLVDVHIPSNKKMTVVVRKRPKNIPKKTPKKAVLFGEY